MGASDQGDGRPALDRNKATECSQAKPEKVGRSKGKLCLVTKEVEAGMNVSRVPAECQESDENDGLSSLKGI